MEEWILNFFPQILATHWQRNNIAVQHKECARGYFSDPPNLLKLSSVVEK